MNKDIVKQFMDAPQLAHQILGSSLEQFITFFHWYIYHQDFIFMPFHRLIVQKLEDIAFGRNKKRNLMINIPPRFGKSAIMKYFCAWSFMINPQSNCIYTSYSDDLVSNFSKDIRAIIESPAFKAFTGVKLDRSKTGADYWATEQGGGFRAAPLGGSLTGFGFGVSGEEFGSACLIDDPLKASNVKSQAEMQNCIDYYLNTLKSRANNQAKSPMICIMQRLALEDLAGFIMENEEEDWDIVKLPALNESTGQALWPEKFSTEDLLKLKALSPFVYYGQYQQEPIVVGGSVIKSEWFRYYNPKEHYDYQMSFITSDTAQKKGEANDFTVMCLWGKTFDERLHLIDMIRGKFDAAELKEQIRLFWDKCKGWNKDCTPYGFYIEDKSSGIGVIQELTKSDPIPIIPITRARHKNDDGNWVAMDKFSRCMTSVPYIANGWVYLPNDEKNAISDIVLAETAAFKADLSHKHDDVCFEAGTLISTLFGQKPIEKIKPGELVITPTGLCRVVCSKCTGFKKTIKKFGLKATPNHKVFYKNMFEQLDRVDDRKKMSIISFGGLIKWKYKKLLYSMESNTNLWGRNGIISLSQKQMKEDDMLKDFMWRFGNFIQERKFRKAVSFITKTITLITTTSLIWSVYLLGNILNCIKKKFWNGVTVKKEKNILTKFVNLLRSGILALRGKNGTVKIQKNTILHYVTPKNAYYVTEHLQHVLKQQFVTDAEMQNIIEICERKKRKPVFNLQIEKNNVYYANEYLVSNCDNLFDAIDIAFGDAGMSSIFI